MRGVLVLVLLGGVLFGGIAHADTAEEAKKLMDGANARFAALESDRNVFWKAWDLIDDSAWSNMKHSRDYVLERKSEVDKRLKAGENVDAQLKVEELKRDIDEMDKEMAAYRTSTQGSVWKLQAGAGLFILAVIGMSVLRIMRRRRGR